MENEIWKDIKGYEGSYQISNLGRVKSLVRLHVKKEVILTNTCDSNGYKMTTLTVNGFELKTSIHRLIAIAFIGNPHNKPQVNHINGIKTDNRIENLEWATSKENINHAWDTGLTKRRLGKNSPNHKQIIDISNNEIYSSVKDAANIVGLKLSTLCAMLNGQNKNKTNLRYYEGNKSGGL